jgi:hypothetical protein
VAAGGKADRLSHGYRPARTIVASIARNVPARRVPLVEGSRTSVGFAFQGAAIYALRRNGVRFVCSRLPGIGSRYDPARNAHGSVMEVLDGGAPRRPVIARAVVRDVPADVAPTQRRARPVVVTLAPRG